MAVGTAPASVFDADLPALSYDAAETPADIYPRLEAAQRQAPIALGPYGPEVLSYRLVRSVLRDTRFQIPPGINLFVQGITSGPLWDKVVNSLLCLEGDAHHRLRGLTSKAFTPRATLRLHDTMADLMNELVDQVADAGHCDVVTDIARPYPSPSSARYLVHPARIGNSFRCGPTRSSKPSVSMSISANSSPASCARGASSMTMSTTWSPAAGTA